MRGPGRWATLRPAPFDGASGWCRLSQVIASREVVLMWLGIRMGMCRNGKCGRKGVRAMIKEEQSIVIARPIDEVFAFVADQMNAPRWQQGLLEVRRTSETPLGIGTKHTFVRKFMGRRLEATNEYVEYELNRKVALRSTSGPMAFEGSYLTEPADGGTRVTSRIKMQPGNFVALAEPLISA